MISKERFFVYKKKVIGIIQGEDGLWRDADGTIYALEDDRASVDPRNVCGVGPVSLPEDSPLNEACRPHDYEYSSPAYQAFHTREEADEDLRKNLELLSQGHWYHFVAYPFYWLARTFGGTFWENNMTNN